MRTLFFYVKRQIIQPYSKDGLGGLVAGTEGYVRAKFNFSSDWDDCKKVVGFFSLDGEEFSPRVLDEEGCCMIPKEALALHEFNIVLYGRKDGYTIVSRPIKITQYGGKK